MLIFNAGKDGLKQTFKNMKCNLTISIKSLKNLQVHLTQQSIVSNLSQGNENVSKVLYTWVCIRALEIG